MNTVFWVKSPRYWRNKSSWARKSLASIRNSRCGHQHSFSGGPVIAFNETSHLQLPREYITPSDNTQESLSTAQTCSLGSIPYLDHSFLFPPSLGKRLLPFSTAILANSLSFGPHTELPWRTRLLKLGGPQATSSSYFPCHSEKEEQVAVLDTAVPTVGLGDLPITVARGSVPSGVDCG